MVTLSNSFLDFILEPSPTKTEEQIIYKDYVRGPFTIKNVPYSKYEASFGPNGEEAYIPSDVMVKISKLIEQMYKANTTEIYYS